MLQYLTVHIKEVANCKPSVKFPISDARKERKGRTAGQTLVDFFGGTKIRRKLVRESSERVNRKPLFLPYFCGRVIRFPVSDSELRGVKL